MPCFLKKLHIHVAKVVVVQFKKYTVTYSIYFTANFKNFQIKGVKTSPLPIEHATFVLHEY